MVCGFVKWSLYGCQGCLCLSEFNTVLMADFNSPCPSGNYSHDVRNRCLIIKNVDLIIIIILKKKSERKTFVRFHIRKHKIILTITNFNINYLYEQKCKSRHLAFFLYIELPENYRLRSMIILPPLQNILTKDFPVL